MEDDGGLIGSMELKRTRKKLLLWASAVRECALVTLSVEKNLVVNLWASEHFVRAR